jgi:hypothetical protein
MAMDELRPALSALILAVADLKVTPAERKKEVILP